MSLHGVKPAVEFSRAIDQFLALKDRPERVIAAGDYAIAQGNDGNYKMFHEMSNP